MKILAVALIVVALALGMLDGDCTGAVMLAVLFAPAIFCKKGAVHNEK